MPPPRGGSTAVRGRVFAGWRRLQCDRSSGVTVSSPGPGVRKERSLIELDCKIGATYLRMSQPEDAERHFAIAMKSFEARLARSTFKDGVVCDAWLYARLRPSGAPS